MAKALIVYYSWSGNTRRVAQVIHEYVGGDIVELVPEKPYPTSYSETLRQAKREIESGYLPPLKTKIENIEQYDIVFVGSPNWWGTIAPPVASFLANHNLSGKTIAPFITHGGGGKGRSIEEIKRLCPNSKILPELVVYEDGGRDLQQRVQNWLQKIGLLEKPRTTTNKHHTPMPDL
ncbi:MAG: flavodoxin [Ignisphaera sp.]